MCCVCRGESADPDNTRTDEPIDRILTLSIGGNVVERHTFGRRSQLGKYLIFCLGETTP